MNEETQDSGLSSDGVQPSTRSLEAADKSQAKPTKIMGKRSAKDEKRNKLLEKIDSQSNKSEVRSIKRAKSYNNTDDTPNEESISEDAHYRLTRASKVADKSPAKPTKTTEKRGATDKKPSKVLEKIDLQSNKSALGSMRSAKSDMKTNITPNEESVSDDVHYRSTAASKAVKKSRLQQTESDTEEIQESVRVLDASLRTDESESSADDTGYGMDDLDDEANTVILKDGGALRITRKDPGTNRSDEDPADEDPDRDFDEVGDY